MAEPPSSPSARRCTLPTGSSYHGAATGARSRAAATVRVGVIAFTAFGAFVIGKRPTTSRGDTARMMFYMLVRYEGNDANNTPDLELVDEVVSGGEPRFGKLCTLLEWHQQDAVSDEERRRNDIVFSWQGNRNPFIDHPEFAQAVWGPECGVEPVVTPTTPKVLLLERIDRLEAELQELRRLVEESF